MPWARKDDSMHSVAFYSFRVLVKKGSSKSKKLNDLGSTNGKSAFDVFNDYFNIKKSIAINSQLSKSLISLENLSSIKINSSKKLIFGYLKVGKYGETTEIKNNNLSLTKLKTLVDDVTLRERYIMIYLPDSLEEGFIAIHGSDGTSARTVLFEAIIEYFKVSYNLEARFNPLCHKKIPDYILDSEVKEIKAIGFKTPDDIADSFATGKTNIKTDLIIKNNQGLIGSFRQLKSKAIGNVIEIIEDQCDEVKVTLKIGNRNIIFNYGTILKKGINAELDDSDIDIDPSSGIPNLDKLHNAILSISNEILLDIHSGNSGVTI